MKLTGKCKIDFAEWYKNTYQVWSSAFFKMNLSMQYGVLVDFFDSVGFEVELERYFDGRSREARFTDDFNWNVYYDIYKSENTKYKGGACTSRHEAREQAILKANTIYNEK